MMLLHYSSAPDTGLETQWINQGIQTIEKGRTNRDLAEQLRSQAGPDREVPGEVREYIAALQSSSHTFVIDALPDGIGGQWDGQEIVVASSTLEVGSHGVRHTIAHAQEVIAHEAYHAIHGHTEPMKTVDGQGVIIAGEGFTATELIEGVTVAQTGEESVDESYKRYRSRLLSVITTDEVEAAISKKDLTLIDDRSRNSATMTSPVLSPNP
ncbi:MAG: hypothetical protein WCG83_03635 [Candidatus Peregrinibacteria bacterium]